MKRLALTLLCLLLPSVAGAAMTCVDDGVKYWSASGDYRLSMTCTFDTTPGTAVDTLPATIQAVIDRPVFVTAFSIVPGDTGPTDNSDLEIKDAVGRTIVSAAGNGANVIDETTVTSLIYGDGPTAGSTNHHPKGDGQEWTVTVTNNAVNSSSFQLIMQAEEQRRQ